MLFESFDLFLIKDMYYLSLNFLTLTDALNHNIVTCSIIIELTVYTTKLYTIVTYIVLVNNLLLFASDGSMDPPLLIQTFLRNFVGILTKNLTPVADSTS